MTIYSTTISNQYTSHGRQEHFRYSRRLERFSTMIKRLFRSPSHRYLSVLEFIFAMDQHLDIEAVSHLDQKSVMSRCEEIAIQLNVRCSGLLEISNGTRFGIPEGHV